MTLTMNKEINNKIFVITGGADGIGFQIASNYLKEHAKLAILVDINEEKGNKAAKELSSKFGESKAVFIKCNVVEDLEDTFQKICDKYDKIDVLINSAGIVNESDPKKCTDVNLIATMTWSLKFLEHMRIDSGENGNGGTIINVASIFGYRNSYCAPLYQATKFGVVGFSKGLGHKKNYDKHGVRVIAICPGFTRTNFTKHLLETDNEEFSEIVKSYVWQSAEDVGEKAVEIFRKAESGSIWEIEGGILKEVD